MILLVVSRRLRRLTGYIRKASEMDAERDHIEGKGYLVKRRVNELCSPRLRVDQEDLVRVSRVFSVKVDEHRRDEIAFGRQILDNALRPRGSAKCAPAHVCVRAREAVRFVPLQEVHFVDL